jgi:hypothetical protein
MAYQLDRPERGDGLLVVLRRPQSPYETARLALHALNPSAAYAITRLDDGAVTRRPGSELTSKGLAVTLPERPGSTLLVYRRQR